MASAWQTLNPPVDLSRILGAIAPRLEASLPPGQTELQVIGMEDDTCAIRPTLLRVIDRSKRILGNGAPPQKPPVSELDATVRAESVSPQRPSSCDRITLFFHSDSSCLQTSHPRQPVDLPAIELDPVMRKPLVWSPPPVSNHLCDPPMAGAASPEIKLRQPAAIGDLTQVPPFETRPIAIATTAAAVQTGMPDSFDARIEVSGIVEPRNAIQVRLIGPRLRIGLPALQ